MAKKSEWRFTVRLQKDREARVHAARKKDSRTVNSYVAKAVDEKLDREMSK